MLIHTVFLQFTFWNITQENWIKILSFNFQFNLRFLPQRESEIVLHINFATRILTENFR